MREKVLFIIPGLKNGGAERVVSVISSGLSDFFDITILAYFKLEDEYKINEKINVKYISLSEEKYGDIGKLERLKKMRKYIKQIKPDFIFPFLDHVCIYTFLSLIFSKYLKKISFTVRNNELYSKNIKQIKLKHFLELFIPHIILQNKGQLKSIPKILRKKCIVIPNPIDDSFFNYKIPDNIDKRNIISIGRLVNQKNYDLAIEAFNIAHNKHKELKYFIFGEGVKKEYLDKKIKSLNLNDCVFLCGYSNDMNKIYSTGCIFLMTSLYEGMPNSLAEALSVGLPCISSNCNFGPSDLIFDDKMGILVDGNDPEIYGKIIISIYENLDYHLKFCEYRKKMMISKYGLSNIVKLWYHLMMNY